MLFPSIWELTQKLLWISICLHTKFSTETNFICCRLLMHSNLLESDLIYVTFARLKWCYIVAKHLNWTGQEKSLGSLLINYQEPKNKSLYPDNHFSLKPNKQCTGPCVSNSLQLRAVHPELFHSTANQMWQLIMNDISLLEITTVHKCRDGHIWVFSFIPMIKIHFTCIFDTLNLTVQCCTVTLMTEMQTL